MPIFPDDVAINLIYYFFCHSKDGESFDECCLPKMVC